MNGQTPVGRQRLYTQTLMTRGGTGEVEQQTGTLWLMSSTLNAKHRQGETNTHQEGMERQGRTQDTERTREGMEIKPEDTEP